MVLSSYLAIPVALVAACWVVAGRAVFGVVGDLTAVYAVSLGPVLFMVLTIAALIAFKEMRLHGGSRAGFPLSVAITQAISWLLALIFGLLIPDRVEGKTVSALSAIGGEHLVGLSAGFGNTFGILTFCFAFAALFCAVAALRRARRLAAGISEEDVEAAARASSKYAFLDEE